MNQILQNNDSALWNMTSEELNVRIAEICTASLGKEKTPEQIQEMRIIHLILWTKGMR